MSVIPKHTVWTSLGDVVEPYIQQGRPEGIAEFCYIDISSIDRISKRIAEPKILPVSKAPTRARQHLKPADVLVSMTRPNLNAVAMTSDMMQDAIGSTGFCVLRPIEVDPSFLFYLVQTEDFVSAMSMLVQGALYPAVRPKDILGYRFRLPPLSEQHRIVAKVEELSSKLEVGIAELQNAQVQLKRYRQAVLKAAVTGELTKAWREAHKDRLETASELLDRLLTKRREKWEADQLAKLNAAGETPKDDKWRKKYKPPVPPAMADLPTLPYGWTWITVDQAASFEPNALSDGPFGSNLMTKHYTTAGPRVIRLQNIGDGIFVDERAFISRQHFDIPDTHDWTALRYLTGDALEVQYRHTLEGLGKMPGMLGVIFRKAQNRVQDPAKLNRLISMIDSETWTGLDVDVKGSVYEGLLQKNAEDVKTGAGQYFTPRDLIKAIVEVMRPKPDQKIADPACGTGGFLLATHDYIAKHYQLDRKQKQFLKKEALRGWEIVDATARLCVMNLYLHGIGSDKSPVIVSDSLASEPAEHFDLVLTNPPFGKKSSITVVNEEGEAAKESLTYARPDFFATTSNKQLNFVQHIHSLLKMNGTAAVVVPDNVLFEGGAGETIRRRILKQCDVHTLLRLPTGIFYAQGVKANLLFFDKRAGREQPWTDKLWIYDLRTNKRFTLKTNPLKYDDLTDFIECYNAANRHERKETERFKSFTYDELMQRDKVSLDIFWLKDDSLEDSANLPSPEVLAQEISENLQAALEQFNSIYESLSARNS